MDFTATRLYHTFLGISLIFIFIIVVNVRSYTQSALPISLNIYYALAPDCISFIFFTVEKNNGIYTFLNTFNIQGLIKGHGLQADFLPEQNEIEQCKM